MITPAPPSYATLGSSSTVYNNGRFESFPGIAQLGNGTLVVVWEDAASELSGDGILLQSKSTDNGATWSAPTTIYNPGAGLNVAGTLTLLSTGNLLLSGFTIASSDYAFVMQGAVSGSNVTWGSPIFLTPSGFIAGSVSTGPSNPIELVNHHILLPIYGTPNGGGGSQSALMESSDAGATWGNFTTLDATPGSNEVNGALLASGRLVFLERAAGGYYQIYVDGWGTGSQFISPRTAAISSTIEGRPTVLSLGGEKLFMLARSDPNGYTAQTVSGNEGFSWRAFQAYNSTADWYSGAVLKQDGNIGAVIGTGTISGVIYQTFVP